MRGNPTAVSRLIICALLVLAGYHVLAAAQEQENQPVIVFEEILHDFGTVFEQPSYKYSFVVKNEGKADLLIKDVKPG